jgi:hypothetical protein
MKRRCVSEGEDSENESKLSEPRTSKAVRVVTAIKKIRLYNDRYLAWVLHGLETNISQFHCELCAGKTNKHSYGPSQVK